MFARSHRATSGTRLLLAVLLAWTATAAFPSRVGDMQAPTADATDLCPVLAPLVPCSLRFVTQPADAEQGEAISSVAFDPTGGGIQVEVVDFLGQRVTSSTAEVTMAIGDGPKGAKLEGEFTQDAVAGVATFTELRININAFGYTLKAASPGLNGAESQAFDIWGDVTKCDANTTCTASVEDPKGQMSSTVTGTSSTSGHLLMSLGAKELSCNDSFNHAPSVVTVDVLDFTGPKTATMTISKEADQDQPNNGVSFYQVCYEAPTLFTDRDGGEPTNKGLLPDCAPAPQTPVPPCVKSKTKKGNGAVEITLLLPAGDPNFH